MFGVCLLSSKYIYFISTLIKRRQLLGSCAVHNYVQYCNEWPYNIDWLSVQPEPSGGWDRFGVQLDGLVHYKIKYSFAVPVLPSYFSGGWIVYAYKWVHLKWRTVGYRTAIKPMNFQTGPLTIITHTQHKLCLPLFSFVTKQKAFVLQVS